MAVAMSEIILCEDSEITAGTAVVMKNGSPKGCGIVSPGEGRYIIARRWSCFSSGIPGKTEETNRNPGRGDIMRSVSLR